MAGVGQAQRAVRVGYLHFRQPGGELRRVLEAQQAAGVQGIVELVSLVQEHETVRARNAD